MKPYLSRITARAGGISGGPPVTQSNTIKPIIRQWNARKKADNSNPFEEINTPINPLQNTRALHFDKEPVEMIPNKQNRSKIILPGHDATSSAAAEPGISHTVKHPKIPRHQESFVLKPPASQEKIAGHIMKVKGDTLKPGAAEQKRLEEIEKTVNPVSTATRFMHRQGSIQSMENKRPVNEQFNRETIEPGNETLRLETVSELRPVSPNNPVQFIPLKKEKTGPRLVIGRLNVEVVTPQPVKTQPAKVRTISKVVKSHKMDDRKGFPSKMQFGLGQI